MNPSQNLQNLQNKVFNPECATVHSVESTVVDSRVIPFVLGVLLVL